MNTYKRHRFPPDIISYAVWLYYRFNLSHREFVVDNTELVGGKLKKGKGFLGQNFGVRPNWLDRLAILFYK